ncbi:hypothetical protein N8482_01905 [Chitinophagales bacterium]|nr:hypothetical protein [Chitinophagales bacterium]
MPKKKSKEGKPIVHKDLEGFDIWVTKFGEVKTSMGMDQLNEFLNKEVDDKKLRDRDDLEFIRKKNSEAKKDEEE